MKPPRLVRRLLALALLASPAMASPAEPRIPPYAQVVDEGDLLDGPSVGALQRIIGATEAETGVRMAVLVVPSLEGADPELLAARVYRAWPLGSARADDGLLLLYGVAEQWWQLWWGPALGPRIDDPVRLAPTQRVLANPDDRPLGPRLVEATALLARAAGASARAVADPYEGRRDWGRVGLVAALVGVLAVVSLLLWGQVRLMKLIGGWVVRRQLAGLAGRYLRTEIGRDRFLLRSRRPRLGPAIVAFWLLLATNEHLLESAQRWRRGVESLACARDSGVCLVETGGQITARIPLEVVRDVQVFEGRRGAGLLAVTTRGNVALIHGWPRERVTGPAEALRRLLRDPEAAPVAAEHDVAGWTPYVVVALVGLALALFVLALGPRRLVVDRRRRLAGYRAPLWGWSRPLGELRAIRLSTPRQDQVAKAARERKPMPYARHPDFPIRIEVVDAAGRRLPASIGLPVALQTVALEAQLAGARERVRSVAGELAALLGVPLLPLLEVPQGGVVPSPEPSAPPVLESGEAAGTG